MRRAQARGQERAPHRAGATKLPPVLILRARGDLTPQLRPVGLEGVDQRVHGVGRHSAVADALRLTQRRPELRRMWVAGQLGARAFVLRAAANLVIDRKSTRLNSSHSSI